MPKVLIIGPHFHNFSYSVANAFSALGYTVCLEQYDNPLHPYTFTNKIKYKFSADKNETKANNRHSYKLFIEQRYNEEHPDVVFVLNGDILELDTLDFFRKESKVALWAFDSISRFPVIETHIDHVDLMYCYEQTDIDYYRSKGKTALFLPQAYDDSLYFPSPQHKDIDVLFVGEIFSSSKRREYVQALVAAFPDKRIKIIGRYKPWYKGPIKCLLRERRDVYTNTNVPSFEVNALYNRAKVVLNIHHEQQKDGANPKVFEICGSGAYQVCDSNPYISSLFPNGEVGLYNSKQEMIDVIAQVLKVDNTYNAKAALSIVRSAHTFRHRISQVLSNLNSLK